VKTTPAGGNSCLPAPAPAIPAARGWESCTPGGCRSRTAEGPPPEGRREEKGCATPHLPPPSPEGRKKGPAGPSGLFRRRFQQCVVRKACWGRGLAWLGTGWMTAGKVTL